MGRVLLLWLIASTPFAASAATAYKCVDAKGAISFQDQPCRAGVKEQQIHLRDSSPEPPPPAAEPAEPEYAYDAPDVAPPPREAPRTPPPKFYLCTRYDGSRYMSDTYQPGSALVPLGVLGVPGRSLADAYGGPNGIGVSAPGLRTIPHEPAASVPFGGTSTWIDDECHAAAPAEACAYLRDSLDDVTSKLRRAFSDTEAQLKQQQADLRQRLRGC
jgi:hypothetical protein